MRLPSLSCADCPAVIARPYARFCDACRWQHRGKKRLYVSTPERDAFLCARWSSQTPRLARSIGAVWGWPEWAVKKRAQQLGLCRPTWTTERKPWTAEEMAFLERHAGRRHPEWLKRKLGRSLTSVLVKLKRMRLSRLPEGYSQGDVALAFGVERGTVKGWTRKGWLVPAFHRTQGQPHRFTDAEVLAFLRAHRVAIDLRKVDATWFLDLVLGPIRLEEVA